jgi:hypothetical protein
MAHLLSRRIFAMSAQSVEPSVAQALKSVAQRVASAAEKSGRGTTVSSLLLLFLLEKKL